MDISDLPQPIADYIKAKQNHDTDALLATLADDALVIDEKKEYQGLNAIRDWADKQVSTFSPTYEVTTVTNNGNKYIAVVTVAGNFPGSPVSLPFHFTIVEEKIVKVVVDS